MNLFDAINAAGNDVMLFFTLLIVLLLVVLALNQRFRYQRLKDKLEGDLTKLDHQEASIKKLENDLREYVMGGKSLREWKVVKQQIEELSDLPSFAETEDGYLLKIHLSMSKKDDVRVSGVKDGVNVFIDSKEELPIQAFYSTPKEIDANSLKVTYKGNSLEIKAARAPPSGDGG
ncbi:MAG: Hsp20/alpha crystallin family protein [Candidatus Altiarchaeota archaeon]|nr:Hsp20/alpha crystallin family protein [Candidatus Altiarchaeota archaeon]